MTGGTGHLGREIVAQLKATHRVRVLARRAGNDPEVEWVSGDLATGEGIPVAVEGASAIVHAATFSPAAQRGYLLPVDLWRSPPDVDVDGTMRLLEEAERAGVEHFAYVSIVGVDNPRLPYLRLKHSAEELVRVGNVPWSILRATQFHWLTDRMLGALARMPLLPVPSKVVTQPVDSSDFAAYVVECVASGPGQQRTDFGGPEVLSFHDLVLQWQRARGRSRRMLTIPTPAPLERAAARLTCPTGRRGTTTWSDWLQAHSAE